MKKLLLSLFILLGLSTECNACEYEKIYLMDLEECAFLDKLIGTEYQCMDELENEYILYDKGKEKNFLRIPKDKVFFLDIKVAGDDALAIFIGKGEDNAIHDKN